MSATKPKTPTASGISRLLAGAGFERSTSSPSRIKGWRNYTEGFSVIKDYVAGVGDCITVSWNRGFHPASDAARIRPGELAAYAEAITAAGYSARVQAARDRVIVTTKAEEA